MARPRLEENIRLPVEELQSEKKRKAFNIWIADIENLLKAQASIPDLINREHLSRESLLAMIHGRESPLSRREREILLLVRQKLQNKEIANVLHLSIRTVKMHVSNMLSKLDVDTRNEL